MGDDGGGFGGGDRGGFRGRDDRGRGRGRGRGRRGPRGPEEEEPWVPCTKIGRLVSEGKIKSLEQIFVFSIPIKEHQIVDHFLASNENFADEVMQIKPVQKQTSAGQRTRFKCYVAVGDCDGHVGLGMKCSKEVSVAIRAAILIAKLNIVPVRRGFWGSKLGNPHTVPCKLQGKCASVMVRLIPAPKGTGCVAAPASKQLLKFAGVDDCYTQSRGATRTKGNFIKAVFFALRKSYAFLEPTLWADSILTPTPYQEHTDYLAKKVEVKKEPKPEF